MTTKASEVSMSDLLQLAVDEGASDLHLAVGLPPVLRINGSLNPLDTEPIGPEDTERFMKSITSEDNQMKVRERGGTDFGFAYGKFPFGQNCVDQRFLLVNIFFGNGLG